MTQGPEQIAAHLRIEADHVKCGYLLRNAADLIDRQATEIVRKGAALKRAADDFIVAKNQIADVMRMINDLEQTHRRTPMQIEQIDRQFGYNHREGGMQNTNLEDWIAGEYDEEPIVRDAAAHRIAARPDDSEAVERVFLAVMNARDRELSLPLTAFAERNLLKRRIAVAIRAAMRGEG